MRGLRCIQFAITLLMTFLLLYADISTAMLLSPAGKKTNQQDQPRPRLRKISPHAWINKIPEHHLRPLAAYGLGAEPDKIKALLSDITPSKDYGSVFPGRMIFVEEKALIGSTLGMVIDIPERFRSKGIDKSRLASDSARCVMMLSDIIPSHEEREKLRERLYHLKLAIRAANHSQTIQAHFQGPLIQACEGPLHAATALPQYPLSFQVVLALDKKILKPIQIETVLNEVELPLSLQEALIAGLQDEHPTRYQTKWLSWLLGGFADEDELSVEIRKLSLDEVQPPSLSSDMQKLSLNDTSDDDSDDLAKIILALRYTDQLTAKDILKAHPRYHLLSDYHDDKLLDSVTDTHIHKRLSLLHRMRTVSLETLQQAMRDGGVNLSGWKPPAVMSVTGAEDGAAFLELTYRMLEEDLYIDTEERIEGVLEHLPVTSTPAYIFQDSCTPPSSLNTPLTVVLQHSGTPLTLSFIDKKEAGRGATGYLYKAVGSDDQHYAVKFTHGSDSQSSQLNVITNKESNQESSSASTIRTLWDGEPKGMVLPIAQGTTSGQGEHPSQYLVYEFIDGGNFEDWLQARSNISFQLILKLLNDALVTLNSLHTHDVHFSHGDLSLKNLLVRNPDSNPELLLSDFGYCLPEEKARSIVASGGVSSGTSAKTKYEDQHRHGIHADIFKLGEMVSFLISKYGDKFVFSHGFSLTHLKLLAERLLIPEPGMTIEQTLQELNTLLDMEESAFEQVKTLNKDSSHIFQYVEIKGKPLAVVKINNHDQTHLCSVCTQPAWDAYQHHLCGERICGQYVEWVEKLTQQGITVPVPFPFTDKDKYFTDTNFTSDLAVRRELHTANNARCLECEHEGTVSEVLKHIEEKHIAPKTVIEWSNPKLISPSDYENLRDEVYRFIHESDGKPLGDFHYTASSNSTDNREHRPFPTIKKITNGRHFYFYLNTQVNVTQMMASYDHLLNSDPSIPLNERIAQGQVIDAKGNSRWFILFQGHDFGTWNQPSYFDHIKGISQDKTDHILKALKAGRETVKALRPFNTLRLNTGGLTNIGIRFLQDGRVVIHLRKPLNSEEYHQPNDSNEEAYIPLIIVYLLLTNEQEAIARQPNWPDLVKTIRELSPLRNEETLDQLKKGLLPELHNDTQRVIRVIANVLTWSNRLPEDSPPLTLEVVDEVLMYLTSILSKPVVTTYTETINRGKRKQHALRKILASDLSNAYGNIIRYFGYGWTCDICKAASNKGTRVKHVYTCLQCFIEQTGWDVCENCYPTIAAPQSSFSPTSSAIHSGPVLPHSTDKRHTGSLSGPLYSGRPSSLGSSSPGYSLLGHSSSTHGSLVLGSSLQAPRGSANTLSYGQNMASLRPTQGHSYSRHQTPPSTYEPTGPSSHNPQQPPIIHAHELIQITRASYEQWRTGQRAYASWQCAVRRLNHHGGLQSCNAQLQSMNYDQLFHYCVTCNTGICDDCKSALVINDQLRAANPFCQIPVSRAPAYSQPKR